MMHKSYLNNALIATLAVMVLYIAPVGAQPELGEVTPVTVVKVTDVTRQLKDTNARATLQKQGIDPDYVELIADYGETVGTKAGTAYSQIYRDRVSGDNVLVVSQLPMIDSHGNKIDAGWTLNGSTYISKENLFTCTVAGLRTTVIAESNQPNGIKSGAAMAFDPVLYLGGVEVAPVSNTPTLLAKDPDNPSYQNNVLEWDYGICKRQLRLIEGSILGRWVFDGTPKDDVLIQYNQVGSFDLKLGIYQNTGDSEYITVEDFQTEITKHGYPVIIGDSLTFYPDADAETNSVDGFVGAAVGTTWAGLIGSAGSSSDDSGITPSVMICGHNSSNTYSSLFRSIFLFDTSALPDDATITSATLSIRGRSAGDDASIDPHFNIFACDPGSNTSLSNSDFNRANWTPGTPLSTAIDYATWDTGAYNNFALNADGLALLDKTGVSKFGGMESKYDAPGIKPPEMGGVQSAWLGWHPAEAGAGFKPSLVVVYTVVGAPIVTTGTATAITTTGFTGHGNITDISPGTPVERGVCWNTTGTPTTADDTDYETGTFGTGAFSRSGTGLDSGTVYYYRAYAATASGTGYGANDLFCTLPVSADFPTTVLDLEYEPDQISGTPSYTIDDQSGNDNDATYSLVANPGDLDISLGTLQAASPAEYDDDDSGPSSWVFVGTPPAEPDDFYIDGGTFDQFPGSEAINSILEESDIPLSLFWLTMILALLIVVGFAIYAKTKHLFGLVVAAWLVIFFTAGMGMLDWWLVAICVIYGIGMLIAERDYQLV